MLWHSTHDLIQPTRAVYRAANISAVWQRRIEAILQDIPNVLNFFDDILVFASSFDHLLSSLDAIFQHLTKLNHNKCVFATSAVEFLGHRVDAQKVHKSDKHIKAIRDAPKSSTAEKLQLFLGKATYYESFIPDLFTRNCPLWDILHTKPLQWMKAAEETYLDIRKMTY